MKNKVSVYYGDYLKLDSLLNSQQRESEKVGTPAHDEMLFIITHQTYELWFKQIIFEIDSMIPLLSESFVTTTSLGQIQRRLHRITKIQQILIDQLAIMETMTALDFMDFRDYLIPASGFQSVQFRILETKLGLHHKDRLKEEIIFFQSRLNQKDQALLEKINQEQSFSKALNDWLERMPFSHNDQYDFWNEYKITVDQMLKEDEKIILTNPTLSEKNRELELKNLQSTQKSFDILFDKDFYLKAREEKKVKMSQKALLSCLFIFLYRDLPALQLPYRILDHLIEIDELMTSWRYRHSMMAHRLLGTKIGTGGSSGHDYLKKTAETHRLFLDLFNLATFLIPQSKIPKLPPELESLLDIHYDRIKR